MPASGGTPWFLVRKITDIIQGHTGLDTSSDQAKALALDIVTGLDITEEIHDIRGADYLGGVQITRWVSGFFKQ